MREAGEYPQLWISQRATLNPRSSQRPREIAIILPHTNSAHCGVRQSRSWKPTRSNINVSGSTEACLENRCNLHGAPLVIGSDKENGNNPGFTGAVYWGNSIPPLYHSEKCLTLLPGWWQIMAGFFVSPGSTYLLQLLPRIVFGRIRSCNFCLWQKTELLREVDNLATTEH